MPPFTREYEPAPVRPSGASGLAIASLVVSILGFCIPVAAGLIGLVLGIMAHAQISSSEGRLGGRGLATAGIIVGVISSLIWIALVPLALIWPAIMKVQSTAQRIEGANNLKQIGLALHSHHADHNRLPAAAIKDQDGKPLLSWRVAILPYLDQELLYKQFRLNEPWDSPHNLALLPLMPKIYRTPRASEAEEKAGLTRYRVFVGRGTLFEDDPKGIKFSDVPDGLSSTLLAVEARDPVPWTMPDDLPFAPDEPALPMLGSDQQAGFNMLLADGSVIFVKLPADQQDLRRLIQRNDGQPVDVNQLVR